MFYRSGWLRCVGLIGMVSCSGFWFKMVFRAGVIIIYYTLPFLFQVGIPFILNNHSRKYLSRIIYTYLYSLSPIFSVQYVLKVVRELTWIVLRFSSLAMFKESVSISRILGFQVGIPFILNHSFYTCRELVILIYILFWFRFEDLRQVLFVSVQLLSWWEGYRYLGSVLMFRDECWMVFMF